MDHPDDLKADDLGSWKNNGQHSRCVKETKKGSSVKKVEFCGGKPHSDPRGYCLHRHYFIHHSNSQFKRKINYLTGMVYRISLYWSLLLYVISYINGNRHDITMVQYILPDDKEGIQILPHGNSKSDVPYF